MRGKREDTMASQEADSDWLYECVYQFLKSPVWTVPVQGLSVLVVAGCSLMLWRWRFQVSLVVVIVVLVLFLFLVLLLLFMFTNLVLFPALVHVLYCACSLNLHAVLFVHSCCCFRTMLWLRLHHVCGGCVLWSAEVDSACCRIHR